MEYVGAGEKILGWIGNLNSYICESINVDCEKVYTVKYDVFVSYSSKDEGLSRHWWANWKLAVLIRFLFRAEIG